MNFLLQEQHGGVLQLCLNRPDKLNAVHNGLSRALIDALAHADASDAVRVAVLSGAGRAFCAGRDVSEAPTDDDLRTDATPLLPRCVALSYACTACGDAPCRNGFA